MKLSAREAPLDFKSACSARGSRAGLAAACTAALCLATPVSASAADFGLLAKVQEEFPNTKIGSVHCGLPTGLCEVTTGKNVFYVSPDGRYALVGSLLDLKDRADLTDRRVKELTALDAVTSTLGSAPAALAAVIAQPPAPAPAAAPMGPPPLGKILVDLPIGNAIVHHPGAPLKLKVVSDLNCGYCKMLFEELKNAPDIEVTEYPIQLLRPDSADKATLALCAKDRASTSEAIYFGGAVNVVGDCADAATKVAANTAFAHAHNIQGTPTIIRADGQANAGFMPLDRLRSWLKASA